MSSANCDDPRYSVCSERKGSRNTATTRVGNSSEKPAGRGVEGICLRTVAVPIDACLEILLRVILTFADPSPPSSSSTVCIILSLNRCRRLFSAVRFGRPEPSELLRRMGRFWLRNRSNSARSCEFSCSNSATRSWPACRARLAERVVIWGLSSGLAASGLWAGLAAGERKKVLIVLDLLAAAAAGVFELATASEPLHLGGRRAVNMISLREPAASSAEFSRRVRGQRLGRATKRASVT